MQKIILTKKPLTQNESQTFNVHQAGLAAIFISARCKKKDKLKIKTTGFNFDKAFNGAIDASVAKRFKDSDDLKIKVNGKDRLNIITPTKSKSKWRFWLWIGGLKERLQNRTYRESKTIELNLTKGSHILEIIADRMPILHGIKLILIKPQRIPSVDDPKWTGDFQDDSDQMLLARAIFGEARSSSRDAKIAVGWSIRNRLGDSRWADNYHEVILQPAQYSAFNQNDKNYPCGFIYLLILPILGIFLAGGAILYLFHIDNSWIVDWYSVSDDEKEIVVSYYNTSTHEDALQFLTNDGYYKSHLQISPDEKKIGYFQDLHKQGEPEPIDVKDYYDNYFGLQIMDIASRKKKLAYKGSYKTSRWEWIDNEQVRVYYNCGTACGSFKDININTGKATDWVNDDEYEKMVLTAEGLGDLADK